MISGVDNKGWNGLATPYFLRGSWWLKLCTGAMRPKGSAKAACGTLREQGTARGHIILPEVVGSVRLPPQEPQAEVSLLT